MPAIIEAGELHDSAPGGGVAVTIGTETIALFKVGGAIFAVEAWCLRCGAGLAGGCLRRGVVECSGCDWCYDLATGSVVGIPGLRLHTFDAKVVDGQVIVANA